MNRNKTKLIALFSIMGALLLGAGVTLAPKGAMKTEAAVEEYTEVTSNLTDWSGEYLIVSKSDNVAFNGNLSTLDATSNTVAVSISSGKISLDSKHSFTITKSGSIYDIKSANGKYIYKTADSNGLDSNATANTVKNELTYISNIVTIKSSAQAVYLVYNSTSSQTRFRYFKSATAGAGLGSSAYHAVSLFKKGGGAPAPTLSGISIKSGTAPNKLNYFVGDTFDPTGVEIEALYSDGSKIDVTNLVTYPSSALTLGQTTVIATYEGKTATISGLTVTAPTYSIVKYEVSKKDTLTATDTSVAPVGSSATLVESYSTTKQMTSGHSHTVTLTGYNNVKISEISLSMRSNSSGGSGSLTYSLDNGTTYTTITSGAFNTAAWYGAWSTNYVPVVKAVDIDVSSSIIIKVAATANSLYVESYQLKWEEMEIEPVSSVTVSPKTGTIYSGGTNNKTIQLGASVLPANATFKDINWTSSNNSFATVSSSGLVTAVAPGVATITATAADGSGKQDTATITVVAKAISQISLSGTLSKTEYVIGEPFDPTGLVFTAIYNNGDASLVINHNLLTFNPSTFAADDDSVEVSYGGASVVIEDIVVKNIYLSSLVKSGTLAKASYFVGDTFDPTGLTFSALYSDGSNVALTYADIDFEPSVMAVGTTSVVASYLDKTIEITGISVQQIVLNSISIKTPASKLTFKFGEEFSYAGLVINANYNNETIVKSSGFTVSGVDTMVLGTQKAIVSFGGKSVDYDVKVTNQGASIGDVTGTQYVSPTASEGAIDTWSGYGLGTKYADGSVKLDHSGDYLYKTDIWEGSFSQNMKSISLTVDIKLNGGSTGGSNVVTIKAINTSVSTVVGSVVQTGGFTQDTRKNYTFNIASISGPVTGLIFEFTTKDAGNTAVYSIKATPTYSGLTGLDQATAFANYVMTGIGLNAQGNCAAVLNALEVEFGYMDTNSKTVFNTNSGELFVSARARMDYLRAWVAANSESGSAINIFSSNSIYIIVIVSILGISTLAGYYFIRKRPKEEIN